MEFKGLQIAIK